MYAVSVFFYFLKTKFLCRIILILIRYGKGTFYYYDGGGAGARS